jgi:hypothetical protein
MANNLFVSFDLHDSSRHGALVLAAIEELGHAVRLSRWTWYVRSALAAAEAASRVWDVMHDCDHLLVVDTSHDEAAMFNLDERAHRFMSERWHIDTQSWERPRAALASIQRLNDRTDNPLAAVG